MNQDVAGNKKLFWKEVGKMNEERWRTVQGRISPRTREKKIGLNARTIKVLVR